MRAVLLVLALALMSCSSAGAQTEAQLTPTQIGPVRLGMSEVEIRALGFEHTREIAEGEGGEFVRIIVNLGDERSVVADLYDDRTGSLEITSPVLTTERGAHVGMTLEELRQLYPNGEVNIGSIEGNYFNLRIADGAFFQFHPALLPDSCFRYRGACPDQSGQRSISYFLRDYSK
jgi:hypothetical protein